MITTPNEDPMPIPAFVPVERVEGEVEIEVKDEVGAGLIFWPFLMFGCILDEVRAVKGEMEVVMVMGKEEEEGVKEKEMRP